MVTLAKTAGFCFGVGRAVDLLEKMLADGKKTATLGPIIHNPGYVGSLKAQGVIVTEDPSEVPDGYTLVLRTHGVPKEIRESLDKAGTEYTDAACPFVAKIQNIVSEHTDADTAALIAGDSDHPEVKGIMSYCRGRIFVFGSLGELKKILAENADALGSAIAVSQTTFNVAEFVKCSEFLEAEYPHIRVYNTVCKATSERQEEARRLSLVNDLMIVVGGRNSSNTKKLGDVCRENCDTLVIEDASELNAGEIARYENIGITAGASTPARTIDEVCRFVHNVQKNG